MNIMIWVLGGHLGGLGHIAWFLFRIGGYMSIWHSLCKVILNSCFWWIVNLRYGSAYPAAKLCVYDSRNLGAAWFSGVWSCHFGHFRTWPRRIRVPPVHGRPVESQVLPQTNAMLLRHYCRVELRKVLAKYIRFYRYKPTLNAE